MRRRGVRRSAMVGSLAVLAAAATPAGAAVQQETIVFVRHGEKPPGSLGQLDCQGLNRALRLPDVLARKFGVPQYIFAPDPRQQIRDAGHDWYYVRPLATIEPTAIRLAKPVNTAFGFSDIASLQRQLTLPRYHDALIFVAWEHLMIVKLVRSLMASNGGDPAEVPEWSHDDFDSIYIVRLTRDRGKTSAAFDRSAEGLNGQPTTCP